MIHRLLYLLVVIAMMTVPTQLEAAPPVAGASYGRPSGPLQQSRSVVLARNGMVATSHPLAAQAGLEILKNGGSALDAAIAANAMLGLVEPMSCGVGGDLFLIYWDNKSKKLYGLNASGRSPYGLTRGEFESRELDQIPLEGPLGWSVPGCVSGWEIAHERFGQVPLADILAPAIETANEGFPVSEVIAGYWKSARAALSKWPDSAATYLNEGQSPKFGEIFQ